MLKNTLTGLWQTVDSNGNYSESGGTAAYEGTAVSFEQIFSSIAFQNIDTSVKTADFAIYILYKSLDDGKVITLLNYTDDEDSKCKITPLFANIYKLETNFIEENQKEFYAIKINDDDTASLIMHEIDLNSNDVNDTFQFEGHSVFSLHKKPDNIAINLNDMVGSVWNAQDGNASFVYYDVNTNDYDDKIEVNSLKLTINSVNDSDNSLNAVLTGTFQNAEGTAADINIPLELKWSGYYNMWYGETDSEYFSLSLLTEDTAVFTADIYSYNEYYIEISSTLKKENQ